MIPRRATRDRFRADTDQARADAERLAGLWDHLEEVATGRDEALAHTAVTRDRAERAKIELAIRGIDRDDPTDLVTAEEWLAARDEAERSEDPHREVTDARDLADAAAARTAAHEAAVHGADPAEATDDAASTDDVDPAEQLPDEVAPTATHPQPDSARPCRRSSPEPRSGDRWGPTDGDKDERATPDPARGADAAAGKADRRTEQRAEGHDAPAGRRRVPPPLRTRAQVDQARDALRNVAEQRAEDAALEASDAEAPAEATPSADVSEDALVDVDTAV